ncbi:MAG: CARDB domain-containing protein [Bacteroidota bacterium]
MSTLSILRLFPDRVQILRILLICSWLGFGLWGQAQTIQIGSGTDTTDGFQPSPVNIWYRSIRSQFVYTAAELNAAGAAGGTITEIGFYVSSPPLYGMPNYQIKLKPTLASDVTLHDFGPFQTVYTNSLYQPTPGGFEMLTLDTTFLWDGLSNILVDICFDQVFPTYDESGTVRIFPVLNNGYRYYQDDGISTCGEQTFDIENYKPQVRFTFISPAPDNVGIVAFDSLDNICGGDSYDLYARVRNFGNNAVDSVTINWSFGGILQPSFTTVVNLDSALGSGPKDTLILLGNRTFPSGVPTTLTAYTSNPNGVPDTLNQNDTLSQTFNPGVRGTFTLGGANPDFVSFNAAINFLEVNGVCDTVIINVRPGTYTEQLSIGTIPFADSLNPVIFRSETGDSTDAILTFNSTLSNENWTIRLDGTQGIRFQNMSLIGTGTSYGRVIVIQGNSQENEFSNCIIQGVVTSSTSDIRSLVYMSESSNDQLNNHRFLRNKFVNGSYAFDVYDNSRPTGWKINDNLFLDQYYHSLFLNTLQAVEVSRNIISTTTSYTFFYGMRLNNCNGPNQILANRIQIPNGGLGIELDDSYATSNDSGLVANNFISGSSNNTTYGIFDDNSQYHRYVFNNIRIDGSNTSSTAFYRQSGFSNTVQNNNLIQFGAGYSFYSNTTSTSSYNVDYNNLYAPNGNIGYWGGTISNTLIDWQSASGFESNGLNINPLYTSTTDLHVSKGLLNGAGSNFPDVTTDIDGELRNDPPDIGADEFTPDTTAYDASAVTVLGPTAPFAAGNYDLQVVIRNNGATSIDSLSITWSLNDTVQPAQPYTGNLLTGETDTILLANTTLNAGTLYAVRAWVAPPVGVTELDASDDTTAVFDATPALVGSFTIGGTNPDFVDFTSAVNVLENSGVIGPVIFLVRDGTYNENLVIDPIPNATCDNNIIFTGESGDSTAVVLTGSGTVLNLNGVDGLTFQYMTFDGTTRTIIMQNGAECNTFANNIIEGRNINSTSSTYATIYSLGNSPEENENTFIDNRIIDGSYGIYFNGSGQERSNAFIRNTLVNQYYMGLYLIDQDSVTIEDNIVNSNTSYSSFYGFYLSDCDRQMSMRRNRIFVDNSANGIFLSGCDGLDSASMVIANNFVKVAGSNTSYGLYSSSGANLLIAHNNFLYTGSNTTSSYSLYLTSEFNTQVYNNNFINRGEGVAIYLNNSASADLDYNNYYTEGSIFGVFNGNSNFASLAAWQAATGYEVHSLSITPNYVSDNDLHVNKALLDGAGILVSEVTIDIDGEIRNNPPDIGADEFSASGADLATLSLNVPPAPFAAGPYDLKLAIRNTGADSITSADVVWQVNGITQAVLSYTGTLASGEVDTVDLGPFNLVSSQIYNIDAWVAAPNGGADIDRDDDTLSITLQPALAGSFTIGGISPDYTSITEAYAALQLGGILDTVIFNIRPGTYNERINMTTFPGNACGMPVIFQSETLDSSSVIINFDANSSANYIFNLDGVDGLTFRSLTFQALDFTYGRTIVFTNGATCNTLENCRFIGINTTSTSTTRSVIYRSGGIGNNDSTTLRNNRIERGSYGLYWTGPNSETGLVIEGNTFFNNYSRGLYTGSVYGPKILRNTIYTTSNYNSFLGIYTSSNPGGTEILQNRISIQTPSGGDGLYLISMSNSGTDSSLVANNFVHVTGSSNVYGVYSSNNTGMRFYHNSVNVTSTNATSSFAYYKPSGGNEIVRNNILANTGGGYVINNASSILNSDYNVLYTTGPNLALRFSTPLADLAAWTANSNQDSNSVSLDPLFDSDTALYVNNVAIDGLGFSLPIVQNDIDGQTRNVANPDPGADEFSTATEDASILAVLSPQAIFPDGTQPIRVVLFNNATDTLNSVAIEWEINGQVQSTFNFSGTILSGDTLHLNIGTFDFEIDSAYNLSFNTSLPNGLPDQVQDNDTLRIQNLYAGLAGFYTIGGSNPDFNTFGEAINAAVLGGLADSVTFNVRSDTFVEQVIIPEIPGTGPNRILTFQSESGDSTDVVWTFNATTSGTNYTINLNGADYIRFKNLTLQSTGNTYGRIIRLENGATHNTFVGNRFQELGNPSTNNSGMIYSPNSLDDFTLIEGNYFEGGQTAIEMYGVSTSSREQGTIVRNNIFSQQDYRSIFLYYFEAPEIYGNKLNSTLTMQAGIYCTYCDNGTVIRENELILTQTDYGMYLVEVDGSVGAQNKVFNNFITIDDGNLGYGIYASGSDFLQVYFNNIKSDAVSSIGAFRAQSGSNIDLRNNILVHENGGYALYTNSTTNIVQIDYNNYFTSGTNFAFWNTSVTDLLGLQAITGQNQNSLSVDPLFVGPSDLHVREVNLFQAGTPIAGITTDFDGDIRNAITPDIGADEFVPPVDNDAGLLAFTSPVKPFPVGGNDVKVLIRNFGSDTLTNATIRWAINTIPQPPASFTGSLPGGQVDTLTLGQIQFNIGSAYNLLAWVELPNGQADTINFNDTISVSNLYPALSGLYTIGGASPNFTTFGDAVLAMDQGGIVGPVEFVVRNGVYQEAIVIPAIDGTSATNTVTFRSQSGDSSLVVLERPAGGNIYVLELQGADHHTFRDLTIRRSTTGSSSTYTRVVGLTSGATHNTFTHTQLEGVIFNSTSFVNRRAIVYLTAGAFDQVAANNTFTHNYLLNGSYGIFATGFNTSYLIPGLRVDSNFVDNPYYRGFEMRYLDDPMVRGNVITTNSSYTSYRGLYLDYTRNGFEVLNNKVIGNNAGDQTLYLYNCDGTFVEPGLVANNFVQTGDANGIGIRLSYNDFVKVYHNNVHVTGTNHTGTRAAYFNYGSNVDLRNNVFANIAGGTAIDVSPSNSISGSDFNDLYATGTNLGNWLGTTAPDIASWRTLSAVDANSISVDPLFTSETDLHVRQAALDSAAQILIQITTDIDGESRDVTQPDIGADEFLLLARDLGIVGVVSPGDECGLGTAESITVTIQNFGGQDQTGFDIGFRINNNASVIENVGSVIVPAGTAVDYTFTGTADLSNFQTYNLDVFTLLVGDLQTSNDTLADYTFSNTIPVAGPVMNMLPSSGSFDLSPPVNFSWSPPQGALTYDIYIWEDGNTSPATPTASNLTQITYAYSNLDFGKTYRWKVTAKNTCSTFDGPEQLFTIRSLPDLVVDSITPPLSAFSGQPFSLKWIIRNQGSGGTFSGQWSDAVYLSSDALFDGSDQRLGAISNLTALQVGGSYEQTATFTLPQGISGTYFLFVVADNWTQLTESDENNNRASEVAAITLTPPPDLRVTSVVSSSNTAFSGNNVTVNWTVTNEGTGNTVSGSWRDRIFVSQNIAYNPATAIYLAQKTRNGALTPSGSYTSSRTVTLPQGIFGRYYFHVVTDWNDQVFEFASENNNDNTSDSVTVFLTPPTDLAVSSITSPATASNGESVTIQWTGFNQGGSAPNSTFWRDRVYLSTAADSNLTGAINLGRVNVSKNLVPGQTYFAQKTITIPDNVNGDYYVYIDTDEGNSVYEYTLDGNNLRRSNDPIQINSPDLKIDTVSGPLSALSGQVITVNWTTENTGLGDVINKTWTDALFLSPNATYNPVTAIPLGEFMATTSIGGGNGSARQLTVTLPNGLSGDFYFHALTDFTGTVFENGADGNNTGVSNQTIQIALAPSVDLVPANLSFPIDSAIAGELLDFNYFLRNDGDTSTYGNTWKDRIYISIDSIWNPSNAVLVKEVQGGNLIAANDSVSVQTQLVLPMLSLIVAGLDSNSLVYVYVQTDADNEVFELTNDELNNISRSGALHVTCPPPVDLRTDFGITQPGPLLAGQTLTLDWGVTNIGSTTAYWEYPFWYDGIFLSPDSVFDAGDIFITDYVIPGPLDNNQSYDSLNATFTIPNGTEGTFCMFMVADHTDLNNDGDVSNNVWMLTDTNDVPLTFTISLPPSPDLVPTTFVAPSNGTAGQPIEVVFTVNNQGLGITDAGSWTDQVFLSTDFEIDNQDVLLSSQVRNSDLDTATSYTDTLQIFLPSNRSGNFILLFKTDANDVQYEYLGENNNQAFSSILISLPPPSDLLVSSISAPDTAIAGGATTISWELFNPGTNPASGFMEEAVYFSQDTVWDISDVLIGVKSGNVNVPPGLTQTRTLNTTLTGLALGDYHVIVRTDILNNIYESNELNNNTTGDSLVNVTVAELPLEVFTADTLPDQGQLFYQVQIPSGLVGETLLLELKGDSLNGNNQLYIRYNDVPSNVVFDFSSIEPFQGNQEALVPSLQAGTYYVLITGTTPSGGLSSQALNIRPSILPFEIRRVTSNEGGNTGSVTVLVEGSKLEANMTYFLEDSVGQRIFSTATFFSTTIASYATFPLAGAPVGTYDVVGVNLAGDTTRLVDGFTVVTGTIGSVPGGGAGAGTGGFSCSIQNIGFDGSLATDVNYPFNTRLNRVIPLTILFQNNGNVDIPAPTKILISLEGAPLSFDVAGLEDGKEEVFLEFAETNGPPGILRPGANGSITVYTKAVAPMRFLIID